MSENGHLVLLSAGSKVRVWALVADGTEGAQWIIKQIDALHLDPRSVQFELQLDTYGLRSEVWLEGTVDRAAPTEPTPFSNAVGP